MKRRKETIMFSKKILLCWTIILQLLIVGCASYKAGRIDTKSIEDYANHAEKDKVLLAADPYDTSEKAKAGFYEDVTEKGFYPVHLIIKNDSNERILILEEEIELVDTNGNTYRTVHSNIMSDACEHNKMSYALLGFGIFSYMSAEEANRKMATDWREKECPAQLIIDSGRKSDAFVYFQLPQGKTIKGCKLIVHLEGLETKQKAELDVML
jgi:hypothetical protein